MGEFKAGFARVNITPMLGVGISGYFKPRTSDGVLDELEANALAVEKDGVKAVIIAVDSCGMVQEFIDPVRKDIEAKLSIPYEGSYIAATHSHTTTYVLKADEGADQKLTDAYTDFLHKRLVDAAALAVADLKPAKLGIGKSRAKDIAFVRRYVMKDGSVQTNPGVNNPDIVCPVGQIDDQVNVLRFDREGAETIVLANFGCHPDVVGGNKFSADWPGFFRRRFEKAEDNVKCLFLNGAEGDINHVNVHPKGGDFNDMFNDFDDVSRGYGHARHMGNVVAGAVLSVYDKVEYVDVDSIGFIQKTIQLPVNKPDPEANKLPGRKYQEPTIEEAHKTKELHEAGRDDLIPYRGMMLTTVVAEALRMCRFENGPDFIPMYLAGLKIGPVAFIGIPGEPFNGVSVGLKEAEGEDYKMVCPCCLTDGEIGYFPMYDAYLEGGYESRSSEFKAGTAELIVSEGRKIMDELK